MQMPHPGPWLRPPRRTLAAFIAMTLALSAGFVWLGWRLVAQERTLARHRLQERLGHTADVVTLGLEKDALEPFSHVVTPELAMSSVVSTTRDAHRVLTLYFAGSKADSVARLADDALLGRSLDELGRMGIGKILRRDLAFSDVQRWQELGTIVSEDVYRGFSDDRRQPLPRVLLAGDYTQWDPSKIPYGMGAAIQSGRWAGKASRRILERRGSR